MNWERIKAFSLLIGMLFLISFFIWSAFTINSNLDENEDFCDTANIGNEFNTTQYYDLGGWCCYTDDYREEHCVSTRLLQENG